MNGTIAINGWIHPAKDFKEGLKLGLVKDQKGASAYEIFTEDLLQRSNPKWNNQSLWRI